MATKPLAGQAVRLTARVYDGSVLTRLHLFQQSMTARQLSEIIGAAIPEILRGAGYYYVYCPACRSPSLEAHVKDGRQTDDWACPVCKRSANFLEWKDSADPTP